MTLSRDDIIVVWLGDGRVMGFYSISNCVIIWTLASWSTICSENESRSTISAVFELNIMTRTVAGLFLALFLLI